MGREEGESGTTGSGKGTPGKGTSGKGTPGKGTSGKGASEDGSGEEGGREWEEEEVRELTKRAAAYYHGTLPRQVVERVLAEEGEFLLRFNEKEKNRGFVISVHWEGQSRHFKVMRKRGGLGVWLRKDKSFRNVAELVDYYVESGQALTGPETGEEVKLVRGVGRERWELRGSDVELEGVIGAGAFGEVWRAKLLGASEKEHGARSRHGTRGSQVAVKLCKERGAAERMAFTKEAMFQLRFFHPNVLRCLGVVLTEDQMMIVLEFMKNGSLHGFLVKQRSRVTPGRALGFLTDAARGLKYLHTQKVIHRDVASRNCLLSGSLLLKISDFGLARSQELYKMAVGKVAIKWMAPESMRDGEYTGKSDVWAFGVLIWEVLSFGAEPYPGLTNAQVKHRVLVENYRLAAPLLPLGSPALAALLRDCHEAEPERRPSMAEILERLKAQPGAPADPANHRQPRPSSKRHSSNRTIPVSRAPALPRSSATKDPTHNRHHPN